ncbi:MAG: hypothetical protein NC033_04035 [Clostridiales bacterium]|nr:hypothetical protein [Clostridiales bacterium]
MAQTEFRVKQSKLMIILATVAAGIFEILFLVLAIVFLLECKNKQLTSDEYSVYGASSVFSGIFAFIILIMIIYIISTYFRQTDVYLDDKMYRMKGNKIIFELPYKNIISIKEGFNSIYFFLKQPIEKKNGKTGPKTFYEHYSKFDVHRIIKIVNSDYLR